MKVVIDTNVLISGAFFTGLPSHILDACLEGKYQIVVSPDIIGEYRRVGEEFSGQSPNTYFENLLSFLLAVAIVVIPAPLRSHICRDPEDDKFITCAIESHAKVIVSGDKDLLSILSINGIEILSPRGFITKYMQASGEYPGVLCGFPEVLKENHSLAMTAKYLDALCVSEAVS